MKITRTIQRFFENLHTKFSPYWKLKTKIIVLTHLYQSKISQIERNLNVDTIDLFEKNKLETRMECHTAVILRLKEILKK